MKSPRSRVSKPWTRVALIGLILAAGAAICPLTALQTAPPGAAPGEIHGTVRKSAGPEADAPALNLTAVLGQNDVEAAKVYPGDGSAVVTATAPSIGVARATTVTGMSGEPDPIVGFYNLEAVAAGFPAGDSGTMLVGADGKYELIYYFSYAAVNQGTWARLGGTSYGFYENAFVGGGSVTLAGDVLTLTYNDYYDCGFDCWVTQTFRRATFPATFLTPDRGGTSLRSSGLAASLQTGYASVQPASGSAAPSGLAILGLRQNNVFVSEASVPASSLIQSGRIYAEANGSVNTGIAIANPSAQSALISFFFTNSTGDFSNASATIPPNGQIAAFLNQPPFNGPSSMSGTFTFRSSVPVAAVALRGLTNERSEFLFSTMPVADLSAPSTQGTVVLPHFAQGGGWSTQIVLFNPTDTALTGTVEFRDQQGQAVTGQLFSTSTLAYSIPARGAQTLQPAGGNTSYLSGSVRVIPAISTAAPTGAAMFSLRIGGITVTEAGIAGVTAGSAFRLYAETSGSFGKPGSIQTGLTVANNSAATSAVSLDLTRMDGSSTGLTGNLSIPGNGQTSVFLNQIPEFASLPAEFQGILRVSSAASISVVGVRGRYNERSDFLFTATPPANEAIAPSRAPVFFPHLADSGGYTTQFILFTGQPGPASSGTIQLFSQTGDALRLPRNGEP